MQRGWTETQMNYTKHQRIGKHGFSRTRPQNTRPLFSHYKSGISVKDSLDPLRVLRSLFIMLDGHVAVACQPVVASDILRVAVGQRNSDTQELVAVREACNLGASERSGVCQDGFAEAASVAG